MGTSAVAGRAISRGPAESVCDERREENRTGRTAHCWIVAASAEADKIPRAFQVRYDEGAMPLSLRRVTLVLVLTACGHSSQPVEVSAPPPASDATDAAVSMRDAVAEASDAPVDEGAPARVRIMAANISSGSTQSYETAGIHIFQGLGPDIVLIQEFKYAAGDLRALVDTAFGRDFEFYVEPRSGGIPNGIISRYPIRESGVWADASTPDRAFAYARIDVPGSIDLWAVSIHLLTTGAAQRDTEAVALAGYLKSNVPAGDYLVVGGDLNTATQTEPALINLQGFVVASAPYPADQSSNSNTSINRNHPHDWVLARANLDARQVPVSIGAATFPAGLVFDSRVFAPLTDVAPVLAADSAATGMQHMPVVRDFRLGGAK